MSAVKSMDLIDKAAGEAFLQLAAAAIASSAMITRTPSVLLL